MTSRPVQSKTQEQSSPIISPTSSSGLLSLPPPALTKIFHALAEDDHPINTNNQNNTHNLNHPHTTVEYSPSFSTSSDCLVPSQPHPSHSSLCKHAWIQPAFQLACATSHLYLLYCNAMYNSTIPPLEDENEQQRDDFLTTDCTLNCFNILLSGLSSIHIRRRGTSSVFDAEFVMKRKIPRRCHSHVSAPSHLQVDWERFSTENSTLITAQIEQLFNNAASFPSVQVLELCNLTYRDSPTLWDGVTSAWPHSLQSLSVEDGFCQFDDTSFVHISRLHNLERLVINSHAVNNISPLCLLTNLKELILHNCRIGNAQVAEVISNMTRLQVFDVTETCVTPDIVSILPSTLVRFAGGDRDAHCGEEDRATVQVGLPPINMRQAMLFEHHETFDDMDFTSSAVNTSHWRNVVTIPDATLPNLKFLEWGEWRGHKQSAKSLSLIIPQLESLCLCGPDYDDEVCDALLTSSQLRCIELYGCSVTDATALVLSQHPFLEFINITNCKRVTPHGLRAICTGRGARSETLESVFFFGQVQAPSEALSDLLEDHRDMFTGLDGNEGSEGDSEMSVEDAFRDINAVMTLR